jgi:hypothetical protein
MTTALADAPLVIGEAPFALVSQVPDEVQLAFARWLICRVYDCNAWHRYCDTRDALEVRLCAGERADRSVLDGLMDECRRCTDALHAARAEIARLLPERCAWYPDGAGHVWGWAKRSSYCGLELVREPSSRPTGDEAARRDRERYYLATGHLAWAERARGGFLSRLTG